MTSPHDQAYDFDANEWVAGSATEHDILAQFTSQQGLNIANDSPFFPQDSMSPQHLSSGRYSPSLLSSFAPVGPRPGFENYMVESNGYAYPSIEQLALPQPLAFDSFDKQIPDPLYESALMFPQFNGDPAANFNPDSYEPNRRQSTKLHSSVLLNYENNGHSLHTPSIHINDDLSPMDLGSTQPQVTTPQLSQRHMDGVSYLNSYAVGRNSYHELSPVESTVSLTPSASSVPSTQASFFSATQSFHRISLDQPPGHSKRPLFDSYLRGKPSFDALHPVTLSYTSGRRASNPKNMSHDTYSSFTNSLTSMIPFINDRSQRSPPLMSGSPQSPRRNQLGGSYQLPQNDQFVFDSPAIAKELHNRNYIRNMFKSSAPVEEKAASDPNYPVKQEKSFDSFELHAVPQPLFEDGPDFALPDVSGRKQRRRKRNLFTRFVPGSAKTELVSEEEFDQSQVVDEKFMASVMFTELDNAEADSFDSKLSSRPSSSTSHLLGNNDNSGAVDGYDEKTSHSHDYTALFKNVGKRSRNLVKSSTYRKAKKLKEEESESEAGAGFDTNQSDTTSPIAVKMEDSEGKLSASLYDGASMDSNMSNFSRKRSSEYSQFHDESVLDAIKGPALRSSLKRILGSRLMPSKEKSDGSGSALVLVPQVQVQVDLESLDLPPDTQVYPLSVVAARCKTRGRKQDAEADQSDETKIFLCSYCSRRFKRQEHLKRHFRSLHTLEKPYNCNICSKSFSRTDNLNQHMKTHSQREIDEEHNGIGNADVEMSSIPEE